jgi:hypothetical protein
MSYETICPHGTLATTSPLESAARIVASASKAGSQSTGVFFVAAVVGSTDALLSERYDLMKAGVDPVTWMQLTKWQRRDLLLRHRLEARGHARKIKKDGLEGAITALLSRVLGI